MRNTGRAKILLVDDNPRVRSFVKPALEDAGFECAEASDGWAALDMLETERPDLVVLDIFLGDERMSGLDVCKRMREHGDKTPVIFLTINDPLEDPRYIGPAFGVGGDDFVSKQGELRRLQLSRDLAPAEFVERKANTEELVARIRARLHQAASLQEFDDYLRIDLSRQQVHIKSQGQWQEVRLAPKEFSILEELVRSGGRPVGKNQLMDVTDVDGEGSLQNHIWKLRQKLEPDTQNPRYIVTYHKIGYRFRNSL